MLKKEWKNLFKNKFLIVALIAIITIPTIYTTLFLGSMWDPYGKVDNLPVAVVNEDKPVTYEGKDVNVGEKFVDKLKDNKKNNKIEENLKQVFRPEFLNRIDEIIVFDSLTKTELLQIVELMLKDTVKALADKNISLNVSENAKDFILEKGTNLKYGARPLRRAIQRYVEDEISEMILKGDVHDGQTINVDIENNELKFNIE